jgi:cellulase/cellobiase CelA1
LTRRERVLVGVLVVMAVTAAALVALNLRQGSGRPAATSQRIVEPRQTQAPIPTQTATTGPRVLTAGYSVRGHWKGGFNAELAVTNLGSQPVEGWTVRLQMPPDVSVTGAWAADVTQVASAVTLRSQPWNTYLAPGTTVHLGFQATGAAAAPRACTVNASPC